MPLNFDLGGKVYPPVIRTVTAEEIAAYATASRDSNPRHQPGPDQIGSPIFPVFYGLPPMMDTAFDSELGVDNPLVVLHGEHEIVQHRPTRPGDVLVTTATITDVTDKGKHATYTVEVVATTLEGESVCTQRGLMFVRGAGSGADLPRSEKPSPPEKGDPVAKFTQHVDTEMPPEYSRASGDRNPIHLDATVAQLVGLPGVINHGLGTLSLVTGGIVEHALDGDPERARRVAVRFTDIVIPGTDLDTTVWKTGKGVFFETTRPEGTVVLTGEIDS